MNKLTKNGFVALLGLSIAACTGDVERSNGPRVMDPITHNGINFGIDGSEWANDFECDDPRFVGIGMTETNLLDADTRMDATDCLQAYKAGNLKLK